VLSFGTMIKKLLTFCATAGIALAQLPLPENHQAYAVSLMILGTNGGAWVGSGVHFGDGTNIFLVTATHVLYGSFGSTNLLGRELVTVFYSPDPAVSEPQRMKIDLASMEASRAIKRHATRDLCAFKVCTSSGPGTLVDPVKHVQVQPGGFTIFNFGFNLIGKSADVKVGHDVFIFGYPMRLALKPDYLRFNPLRSMLRKGTVSAKTGYNDTIILDCPTNNGNSGGPAMEAERPAIGVTAFRVIGIVTQSILDEQGGNTGYTIVEPVEAALELMK
jgi:hypothetical protein